RPKESATSTASSLSSSSSSLSLLSSQSGYHEDERLVRDAHHQLAHLCTNVMTNGNIAPSNPIPHSFLAPYSKMNGISPSLTLPHGQKRGYAPAMMATQSSAI